MQLRRLTDEETGVVEDVLQPKTWRAGLATEDGDQQISGDGNNIWGENTQSATGVKSCKVSRSVSE